MIDPFFPACSTCQCWNGDMCELISDVCDRGEMWEPSEDFIAKHPEVVYLVAQRGSIADHLRRRIAELRRLRISQLRRMSQLCGDLEARSLLYAANCQGMNWRRYHDRKRPIIDRVDRFRAACLAEIERLRGMG